MSLPRNDCNFHTVVVLGAGPSGLTAGYSLKNFHVDYTILEASDKVASSWYYVWPNFKLAQQVNEVKIAGIDLEQRFDSNYHLKRDDIIDVFNKYAKNNELNIKFNTRVSSIKKDTHGIFHVETDSGCYTAENVVLGLGARQKPKYPTCISENILEKYNGKIMHSAWYQNTNDYPKDANILVVGSGLSALSITQDLIDKQNVEYKVTIACGYNDAEIIENNHHLPSIPLKLSDLEQKHVENVGRFENIEEETGTLFFQYKKEGVKIDDYHKIIFATGYSYVYDLLGKLLGDQQNSSNEQKEFIEKIINHNNGITDEKGLYLVGVPKKGEKTVTITQGSHEAENVANDIYQKTIFSSQMTKNPQECNDGPIKQNYPEHANTDGDNVGLHDTSGQHPLPTCSSLPVHTSLGSCLLSFSLFSQVKQKGNELIDQVLCSASNYAGEVRNQCPSYFPPGHFDYWQRQLTTPSSAMQHFDSNTYCSSHAMIASFNGNRSPFLE